MIMNPSKYSYVPSYFQAYILVSDFNKYWKEVFPKNIPLPEDVSLPFPTEEEVLFLTEPDSEGYINVLTTVPYVEGYLNEVIVSERLILKLMGKPNLSDLLKYHELYKQPEPMSLYIQGWRKSDSESLYLIFKVLTSNPTRFNSSWNFIKYAVFLKNSDGSEGEFIGEVSNWSFTDAIPSVSYVLSKNYWGNKYGEEFVKAFVEHWWTLPRKDSIIRIPPELHRLGQGRITEFLSAMTLEDNKKSINLLYNLGFIKGYEKSYITNDQIFDDIHWILYKDSLKKTI